MSVYQVLIVLLSSAMATGSVQWFIPRQRRGLPFEGLLWVATEVVAFLCAWLMIGAVESLGTLRPLAILPIADVPILAVLIGAFGGALLLVVPLWFMDRTMVSSEPETGTELQAQDDERR